MADVLAWLADPAHWMGGDGIPVRVAEHLQLSGLSVLVALALALPVGALIGHTGRFTLLGVTVANVGRALPSFALLVMALPIAIQLGLGLGFWPTFAALALLAIPPILTNTYVAVADVDSDLKEAARAMGMRGGQVLLRLELPLALPVVFAGIRIASVQVIATAALGALVAGGGLGRYIIDGLARQEYPRMIAGAVLVAVLALAVDQLLGLLERRLASAGLHEPAAARGVEARYVRPPA